MHRFLVFECGTQKKTACRQRPFLFHCFLSRVVEQTRFFPACLGLACYTGAEWSFAPFLEAPISLPCCDKGSRSKRLAFRAARSGSVFACIRLCVRGAVVFGWLVATLVLLTPPVRC